MATIRLATGNATGVLDDERKEVDALLVPDTDNLFAVHEDEGSDGTFFTVTHVPTGYACLEGVNKSEALWVARQLFAACPEAWRLTDRDEVLRTVPRHVGGWVFYLRLA